MSQTLEYMRDLWTQYWERNNVVFTFRNKKKHRTSAWKTLEYFLFFSLLITVANNYFHLGRIMQRKITGELPSRNWRYIFFNFQCGDTGHNTFQYNVKYWMQISPFLPKFTCFHTGNTVKTLIIVFLSINKKWSVIHLDHTSTHNDY